VQKVKQWLPVAAERGGLMKKRILGISVVIVVIFGFLWWQQYRQDKAFMNSLMLHQSLDIHDVQKIQAWKSNTDPIDIPKDKWKDILGWFNRHPSNMVSEKGDFYDNPTSEAGIIIKLKSGHKVAIYYVKGNIFVSRTDIKDGMEISYKFSEDASKMEGYSKLKRFFEELIYQ
jgi:hypothetical protein